MKLDQFSITEIELTHDQAIQLKIDCINTIENYGIENFETKKVEIDIPNDEDDLIEVSIACETFSIYDDEIKPFDPPLLERSVHLRVKFYNKEGGAVKWKVLGEQVYKPQGGRFIQTPIDIEEEIIKHFTV